MTEQRNDIKDRIERLESAVRELQMQAGVRHCFAATASFGSTPGDASEAGARAQRVQRHAAPRRLRSRGRYAASRFSLVPHLKTLFGETCEALLNGIGMALLLLGVAFMFKYAIDAGWLTETVRTAVGAGIGTILLLVGGQLAPRRQLFAPVLSGGGIAVLYGTVYSAFALYGLIDASDAFTYMAGVTLVGFLISIYHQKGAVTTIAVVGGLATPFVIPSEATSLAALAVYTSLIIAGAAATYLYRGWRLPLFTAALGASVALLAGCIFAGGSAAGIDQIAVQGALLIYWAAFGVIPATREVIRRHDSTRYSSPDAGCLRRFTLLERPALLLSAATPLMVIMFSRWIWGWPGTMAGGLTIAAAVGYGVAAVWLDRNAGLRDDHLVRSHRLAGVALLTMGLWYVWNQPWLTPVIAVEAVLVHLAAQEWRDSVLRLVGNALFGCTTLLMLTLLGLSPSPPIFNAGAMAALATLIVLASYARTQESGRLQLSLAVVAHFTFLAWLLNQLGAVTAGPGLVTITWGAYAAVLFIIGLRRHADAIRMAGVLTLLAAVAKLFVVDLAVLTAIWRILLFIGFGVGLLILSYYVPDLWAGVRSTRKVKA